MTDREYPEPMIAEVIRNQELLQAEFQKMSALIEAQRAEISMLREKTNALIDQLESAVAHRPTFPLPFGFLACMGRQGSPCDAVERVHKEIAAAFYPEASPYLLDAPFIRYRQLNRIDLRGKRVAVLTTAASDYSDLTYATHASCCIELRLQSINGPLLSLTHSADGSAAQTLPCDIESWPQTLDAVDTVWIPDPSLSALVLRCAGLVERICHSVGRQLIFSAAKDSWSEDEARERVHRAGFIETTRLIDNGDAYITRRHEARGFVVVSGADSSLPPAPVEYLVASKIPTAPFRIVQPIGGA